MNDFFKYIKSPFSIENYERFTFNIYLRTIGLSFLLFYSASVFKLLLTIFGMLPEYRNPEVNSSILFFAVAAFLPLIEEIVFRLSLKISKLNIAAFLSVLTILTVKLIFLQGIQICIYFGAIPFFGLIYYIINRSDLPLHKIEIFWKSNFKYIFHFSAIAFGMMHLFNFETIKWWMIVILPLLAAPHITAGYILGYIRMKYGFTYGWLIHVTINSISVILTIQKGIIVVLMLAVFLLTTNYFIQKMGKTI